jgi:hypothetical protein
MPDPRTSPPFEMTPQGPRPRSANHSPLMRALTHTQQGEVVNACPFGCPNEDLDDHGYCRHLVGFTVPGDEKHYEPMVETVRGRVVKVDRDRRATGAEDQDGPVYKEGKARYEEVKKGDELRWITVSARVYRDVDRQKAVKAG